MEHAIVGGAITPGDALRAISERVNCRSLSLGKWLHKHLASQQQRGYASRANFGVSFKTEDGAQGQASAPNIASFPQRVLWQMLPWEPQSLSACRVLEDVYNHRQAPARSDMYT